MLAQHLSRVHGHRDRKRISCCPCAQSRTVRSKVQVTRIQVARTANRQLIVFYRWLGEQIVTRQAQYGWGRSVVEQLAKDLRQHYPNTQGFSARNLWQTRQFYLEYKDHIKLQQMAAEIPWTHNMLILNKIKDYRVRAFRRLKLSLVGHFSKIQQGGVSSYQ